MKWKNRRGIINCRGNNGLVYNNTIFVLSGYKQKGCEYGILNEAKNNIEKWNEFRAIRAPREDAICFLLNEKYIFLIGGQRQKQNSFNYDVFDISSIFEHGKPQVGQKYNYMVNQNDIHIFNTQNAGIINSSNEIFVLGGDKYNKREYLSWKIEFTSDSDDESNDNYKMIEKIILLKNNWLKNYENKGILYFYGQQMFMQYNDYFCNIDFEGNLKIFQKNIFNEFAEENSE